LLAPCLRKVAEDRKKKTHHLVAGDSLLSQEKIGGKSIGNPGGREEVYTKIPTENRKAYTTGGRTGGTQIGDGGFRRSLQGQWFGEHPQKNTDLLLSNWVLGKPTSGHVKG